MLSQIQRGLFMLDFADHHAILGVSVEADVKEIRKRYLKVARRLHPDSCVADSESDKQLASLLLSKLVNPAWEKLSQEKERTEYALLLKLKGQQAVTRRNDLEILSNLAKQLSTANDFEQLYRASLQDLSEKQYQHLDQTLELIAQISELNLVYLARKEGKGDMAGVGEPKKQIFTGSGTTTSSSGPAPAATSPKAAKAAPPPQESIVDQYYRRAETLVGKNQFAQAILELRDALKIEPNNSRCYGLLGMIYLRQNQLTMARIQFDQALKFNPQEPMAVEGKQILERLAQKTAGKAGSAAGQKASQSDSNQKANKPTDKPGGGLFGLFGGKKK